MLDSIEPGRFWRGSILFRKRDGTLLIKCHERRQNAPVFIKYYNFCGGAIEAQREYDALRSYSAVSGNGKVGVPQPIGIFRDSASGAMVASEWVNCPMALTWLNIGSVVPSVRTRVLRDTARWLRWFHDAAPSHDRSLEDSLDLEQLCADLELIAERGSQLLPRHKFRPCRKAILDKAAVKIPNVTHARLHGDLWLKNVLLSPSRTIGLDFATGSIGPIFTDIGKFLSHAAILEIYGSLGSVSRRFFDGASTFIDAYSNGERDGADTALLLFNSRALVDRANEQMGRATSQSTIKRMRRLREAECVLHILGDLMRQLAR